MTNKKIMVADDEIDIAEVISDKIKLHYPKADIEIYTASEKALEILSKKKDDYSLLISDIRFKGQKIQGLELIASARKIFSTLSIIACSANDYKDAALSAGANDFMPATKLC